MDPKVGGTYRMSFANFSTGHGHSFGGEYRELAPHSRICYTNRFEAIPVEMCYLGWQQSLLQLANLVELEIPG
jgi:uncharacterized protein YndB with AHSA1/START domain